MKIKFKKYHKDAVLPKKAYDKDFCYDLVAVTEEEIAPDVWRYGFGFGLQIKRGFEDIGMCNFTEWNLQRSPVNLSIDIRPRSSIWKTGMVLSNSVGTVDEGYTNEISAIFYHVNKSLPRYKVGDRVAQMKVGMTFSCEFVEVEEFEDTERGMKGYGSTGEMMKEVIVKDRDGNVLNTFSSAKECARYYNLTDSAIKNRINGIVEKEELVFEYKDSEADFERKIRNFEKKNVTDLDIESTMYEPVPYETKGRICITFCHIRDHREPKKIGSSGCMSCVSFVGRNVEKKQVACKSCKKTMKP